MPWLDSPHLVVVPVLLPLATAALMLLLGEGRRPIKAGINVASTALGLMIAAALLLRVDAQSAPQAFAVHAHAPQAGGGLVGRVIHFAQLEHDGLAVGRQHRRRHAVQRDQVFRRQAARFGKDGAGTERGGKDENGSQHATGSRIRQ